MTARNGTPPIWPGLRVGLYGGSFNPPHEGHRHVALTALKRLRLDRIWWLVSPQNPLKSPSQTDDYAARLDATRALARHPRMVVSDVEARWDVRYTAQTLALLRRHAPGVRFVWLMGGDNLAGFHRWRGWRDILNTTPVAVMARDSDTPAARPGRLSRATLARAARIYADARIPVGEAPLLVEKAAPAWLYLPERLHPASSTRIRAQKARV